MSQARGSGPDDPHGPETLQVAGGPSPGGDGTVQRFTLTVVDGPNRVAGWRSTGERATLGSHPSCDLVIDDPTVSRFHCELQLDPLGARVRDLGSRNGTVVDGMRIIEGYLRSGSLVRLGTSVVRFELQREHLRLALSSRTRYGDVVGVSAAMRGVFAVLEHAAPTDATVLIEGETGTGKEVVAAAVHQESPRRDGPFVVVDCGAIPPDLLESELFGHERGAFTGAAARRIGAFEEASGGTVFLDEIGELPPDLQPKLLRVLEQRQVRRIGANQYLPVDVRVVAATNRDLRAAINAGQFRPDLYFRLAVVRVALPPLRSRPDDIPVLVERILERLGTSPGDAAPLRAPDFLAGLARAAWPGNVRELRNYLERCVVFRQALPLGDDPPPAGEPPDAAGPPATDDDQLDVSGLTFAEARRQALAGFERRYLGALLRAHGGRMVDAARAAGIDRVYLYKLLRRHGLHRPRSR